MAQQPDTSPRQWPEYRAVLDAVMRAGVANGTTGAILMVDQLVERAVASASPA